MKTVISTPKAPAAIGPYSQAIRKGGTLLAMYSVPALLRGLAANPKLAG